jgi:hypothetical protein
MRIHWDGAFWFWTNWTFGVEWGLCWYPSIRNATVIVRLGPLCLTWLVVIREPPPHPRPATP